MWDLSNDDMLLDGWYHNLKVLGNFRVGLRIVGPLDTCLLMGRLVGYLPLGRYRAKVSTQPV